MWGELKLLTLRDNQPAPCVPAGRPSSLPADLALLPTAAPDAVRYELRMGVHNGRCFVGPLVQTGSITVQPGRAGCVQLSATGPELCLDWVLGDEGVVVVLELLAAPRSAAAAAGGAGEICCRCLDQWHTHKCQ